MSGRFVRVGETNRPALSITIDGQPVDVLEGDTLMIAILNSIGHLRSSEFDDGQRAGFCVMGACQDCWVWSDEGERIRACTTNVVQGMKISTLDPDTSWSDNQ